MSLTSLNLPTPPKTIRVPLPKETCPTCGAGKDRKINGGGFGRLAVWLCEACGHEYTDKA